MWWSLPGIFGILRGPDTTAWHVFRRKRWQAWQAFLEEADVGDQGLLTGRTKAEADSDGAEPGPTCDFGFPCACARSLLLWL